MPGVHRNDDTRKCGAATIVENQSTVFVNNKLASVEGDPCTHLDGHNKAVVGSTVFIENKLIIVYGDTTSDPDGQLHPPGEDDPEGHSTNVFAYGS